MKKLLCVLASVILCLTMAFALTGCGAGDLKGTWEASETMTEGTYTVNINSKLYVEKDSIYVITEISYPGVTEVEKNVEKYVGYEMFEEEELLVLYDENGNCDVFEYEFDGDTLTIKYDDDFSLEFEKI